MSNNTPSTDETIDPTELLYIEAASITLPEFHKRLADCEQEAYKKGYIAGAIAALTQNNKGGTDERN